MKTAKEILYEKAEKYGDGFGAGQVKWIVEAMEQYADIKHLDLLVDIQEYMDRFAEVSDGDYGETIPNEELKLSARIEDIISQFEKH